MRSLSVVIPVLDEAQSLPQLRRELAELADALPCRLQMIFVDDGSTDDSWGVIRRLSAEDRRVEGIRFRRNFGKASALRAGFERASGDVVAMMDADLQDQPAELPKLLARLDEGFDVVSGWKVRRRDPWHKRWPSKLFNAAVSRLSGVRLHDHNCGLKCLRRAVVDEVRLYGEMHRFIPVLAAARGFRVGEVGVAHRARAFGHSKYGWTRLPKGLLDLLTALFLTRFGHRPLHVLGMAGLGLLTAGGVLLLALVVAWLVSRWPGSDPSAALHLHESPLFYLSLAATMLGGQVLATGFVAEMIAAHDSQRRPEFSVAETVGGGDASAAALERRSLAAPTGPHWTAAAARAAEAEPS